MKCNRENLVSKGSDYDLVTKYFIDNVIDSKCHSDFSYVRIDFSINKEKHWAILPCLVALSYVRDSIGEAIIRFCNKLPTDTEEVTIVIDSIRKLTEEEREIFLQKFDKHNPYLEEEKLGLVTRIKKYIKKFIR